MLFWKTKNKIAPRQDFQSKIEEYYFELAEGQVPNELLNQIISKVTDQVYSDYKRFWKQYPKSRKRYSALKMDDIEHLFILYMITDFLHEDNFSDSRRYSKILFKMNNDEYDKYLDNKDCFETK
ncbi:hypothetical protein [Nonlabens marinus]|uniref:Uncharacterized protein n=1 Tax=Nonlabens marinus S1-08 TaxID=1454201 RepID=W8VWK3_9FLAO|nr:hypothetical protein [Nonlabens marinus]BAO54812.1 hypothetical protein NMS_0803 [Nonlabens marinus S1-08]